MTGTVYALFSSCMWPENQVSRVPGEVEHQETMLCCLQRRMDSNVLSLS